MSVFQVFALLLTLSALFSYLNYRFIKLPVKAPFKFAFEQLVWDGRAIHLHQGAVPMLATFVDSASNQFFSGSRFSKDQNIGLHGLAA